MTTLNAAWRTTLARRLALMLIGTLLGGSITIVAQSTAPKPVDPFGPSGITRSLHLSLNASIKEAAVAPGGQVSVVADVTPQRTIHVYAPGKHDYQVVDLIVDPQPWLRLAPTTYPASEVYDFVPLNEKVAVYSKPFRLVRAVTILQTPEAMKFLAGRTTVTLTGALAYQACDDKVCYRPARLPVTLTVALRP